MEDPYLAEQLHLMGVRHKPFGHVPVDLLPQFLVEEAPEPLEERSMTLFKGVKEMKAGLERAYRTATRVQASVQSTRRSASRSAVNEKAFAVAHRFEQEIATAMDALQAASDALSEMDAAQKAARREQRNRR